MSKLEEIYKWVKIKKALNPSSTIIEYFEYLFNRIKQLEAKLDARCDHSELLREINELTRHNKVLQKADMHREKIWKKRIAELEEERDRLLKHTGLCRAHWETPMDKRSDNIGCPICLTNRIAELEARLDTLIG